MSEHAKPLQATLSFWCAAIGLAGASHRKTRTAAGAALLLAGLGYLGVLWERYAQADLRHVNRVQLRADANSLIEQLVLHAGMVAFGWRLIRASSSRPAALR